MRKTIGQAFLLAAGLLCGAAPLAFAQAPAASPTPAPSASPTPIVSTDPDARPAHGFLAAAYMFDLSQAPTGAGQLAGFMGGDAPVGLGSFFVRPSFRVAFDQVPGVVAPAIQNLSTIEVMGRVSKTLSQQQSFRVSFTVGAWVEKHLPVAGSATGDVPDTYGIGAGFEGHASGGAHVVVLVGRDTYAVPAGGTPSGVQVRAYGKIPIPGTSVTAKDGTTAAGPVGSLIFDAHVSVLQPPAVAAAGATPAPPSPLQVGSAVSIGLAVDAGPLFAKWFGSLPTGTTAPAGPATVRATKAERAKLAYGPPAPRSRWS